MQVADAAGLYSPWQPMGTWTAAPLPYPNALPQAVSVNPTAGSGMAASFQFVASDQNGQAYLNAAQLVFGSFSGPACESISTSPIVRSG